MARKFRSMSSFRFHALSPLDLPAPSTPTRSRAHLRPSALAEPAPTSDTVEKLPNQSIPGRPSECRTRRIHPPKLAPTPILRAGTDSNSFFMINRRDLLRMGFCAGAGLLPAARKVLAAQAAAVHSGMRMPMPTAQLPPVAAIQQSPPVALASYVTPLSIPPVIRPGAAPVHVHLRPFRHK